MEKLRHSLRDLLPGPLRERYHRYAIWRDFGIDRKKGIRRPTQLDRRRPAGLNLIGYFESPSGIGQSARALALAAATRGIPVQRIEASSAGARPGPSAPYDINLYHVNADGAAGIVEELGPSVHRERGNVGYWYWESENFPPRWKDRFDYFDEIWVASEFCRHAIEPVSPVPVVIVPPAVTLPPPPPDARRHAGLPANGFLFLSVLDALSVAERKNPLGTIRAFVRAFSSSSEVSLLLQVSNEDRVPGLSDVLADAARGANIVIRYGTILRDDLASLFAACDAYVSLHRAEGFGFPIAEAMSLAKPVVATDYSGSADYLDEATGFPVRWRRTILAEPIRDYDRGTAWAEPDEEHAARMLRRVVEDPGEASSRGRAAQHRIAERYAPAVVGQGIARRLEDLRARLTASGTS